MILTSFSLVYTQDRSESPREFAVLETTKCLLAFYIAPVWMDVQVACARFGSQPYICKRHLIFWSTQCVTKPSYESLCLHKTRSLYPANRGKFSAAKKDMCILPTVSNLFPQSVICINPL